MTTAEAIKNLEDIKRIYTWSTGADDALDMAIKALKNQAGARGRVTNIEKLRAMTDEEIAEAVCKMTECKDCVGNDLCIQGDGEANGLIKWLKEEAVEDDQRIRGDSDGQEGAGSVQKSFTGTERYQQADPECQQPDL